MLKPEALPPFEGPSQRVQVLNVPKTCTILFIPLKPGIQLLGTWTLWAVEQSHVQIQTGWHNDQQDPPLG